MADSIKISLIDNQSIKDQFPYWHQFLALKNLLEIGKEITILHVDYNIDTGSAAAAETTKPTNEILNFTTPQQVYIRSDAAGDTSKKIDVIGQKADGSFGQFTLTSNASNGTTPVDVGTWNFIMIAKKNDAWAGNCIIDDDGISTTVFFTCALGATQTLGILVFPEGYYCDVIAGYPTLLNDPGSAGEGMLFSIGDLHACLSRNKSKDVLTEGDKSAVIPEKTELRMLNNYLSAAVTASYVHMIFVFWQQPSNI